MTARSDPASAVAGKVFDGRLLRRIAHHIKPHWKLLAFAFALIPIASAFELALPYTLKYAIDSHISVHIGSGLAAIAALYAGGEIARALVGLAMSFLLSLVGERTMHDIRCAVHAHVITRNAGFFDRTPVGRLLTGMTNDVANFSQLFVGGVVTLFADLVILLAIFGMMLYLSVGLTLVTLALSPVLIVLFSWSGKIMRTAFRQLRVKTTELNTYLVERLTGLSIVQSFCREDRVSSEFATLSREYREASVASQTAASVSLPVTDGIALISGALVIAYAGWSRQAAITAGLVVAFVDYARRFFSPVNLLASKYVILQQAMAAAERVFELLDTDALDAPSSQPARVATATSESSGHAIELRDVRFEYRAGEPVLHGVSLAVPRGSAVAVVGATGSGKSTLVRLLSRNYDVLSGEVRMFGRDVRDWPTEELRRRLTIVSQDVFLFSGTIADNVRIGRPDADIEEVEAALRQVGAVHMLEREEGVLLQLAERGSNLSTGERQLVAFARALIRDPEVLVLDEATAHVDPETEETIERALASLFSGRTCLIIAHRLSTIRRADYIVVLARGRVAEQGTRDELLAANGLYARYEAKVRDKANTLVVSP